MDFPGEKEFLNCLDKYCGCSSSAFKTNLQIQIAPRFKHQLSHDQFKPKLDSFDPFILAECGYFGYLIIIRHLDEIESIGILFIKMRQPVKV